METKKKPSKKGKVTELRQPDTKALPAPGDSKANPPDA